MKYLYSTESKTAFQWSERLKMARADMVELEGEELAKVQAGMSLESVLAERSSAVVVDVETPPPALPAAAPSEISNLEDWKIDPEDNGRAKAEKMRAGRYGRDVKVQVKIPAKMASDMKKEQAAAGIPDVFGASKDAFMGVGHWNVTEEMLDDVKNEDLVRFALQACEANYDDPTPDMNDSERLNYYTWMRKDIRKKIRRMARKRAERKARTEGQNGG